MSKKLDALKAHLKSLTFARVNSVVLRDENLLSFRYQDVDYLEDDPGFASIWNSIPYHRRSWSHPQYSFYFGFADGIHFDSKGHEYQTEARSGLGVLTKQYPLSPPIHGTWIVGVVQNQRRGRHLSNWCRCTEEEKLFTEYLLSGTKTLTGPQLDLLYIKRPGSEGSDTSHLCELAELVILEDLNFFLNHRQHFGGAFDEKVHSICQVFNPELWDRYVKEALEQDISYKLKYSGLIQDPGLVRSSEQVNSSGGINTPFASLTLT